MPNIRYEPIMTPGLPVTFWETTIYTTILSENWHENIELIFAVEGSGYVKSDFLQIPIKKDEFCVINSNCLHNATGNPSGLSFYNIQISNDFCNQNGIDIQNYVFDNHFADDFLKEKLLLMYNSNKNITDPLRQARISAALLEFTVHLIEHHSHRRVSNFTGAGATYDINLAIGYIKSHLNEKITIDKLALQAGLSKYHFQRKFKQIMGYSAIDYINFLRCADACNYLKIHSYSVHDVFQMSCFNNYSYFAKMFKKYIGVSPSEYKKMLFEKKELPDFNIMYKNINE